MTKYWIMFKVALSERIIYRGDFFISALLRFVPIITTILLWRAIYEGSDKDLVGGLTYSGMVSYYLFVMVTRAFGSMPGLATGISTDVREGGLRKFLIQPVDYIGYLLTLRAAHKVVLYVSALLPYLLVFLLCRRYLPGWPDALTLSLYVLTLLQAFLLGFLINCFIGMLSFWFLEIGSFMYIFMILQYFLSGHMFPLNLLPGGFREVVLFLPFAYETYYPTMIILRVLEPAEMFQVVYVQLVWIIALAIATRIAWHRGLRRYAAFGG